MYRRRATFFLQQQAPFMLSVLILVISLVAYLMFFNLRLHRLPGSFEWTSTVNTTLPVMFVSVGQGLVLLTRGLDLSVGGVMDVTNSLAALHMHESVVSMVGWSLLLILIGAAIGAVNGLLVTIGRLQPILVTIATLSILQGLAVMLLPEPGGSIPKTYATWLVNPSAPSGLIYIAILAGGWMLLRRTRLGHGIFAVGNDEEAARANGVAVYRTKTLAYALSGALASIAGLFIAASATGGDATGGDAFLLTSFAAVVLGGISFFGGRGNIIGAMCGAAVLTVLVSILFFAHVNSFYQAFYQGVFLIGAILLGLLIGRVARRRAGIG